MYNLMGKCAHCGQWHIGGSWWPAAERPCARCHYRIELVTLHGWLLRRKSL